MTSALALLRTHGSSLHALSRKGKLSKSALVAAGSAILAAYTAEADHTSCVKVCSSEGEGIVTIGQSLIGATHSHQNGLTHNHGPLSILPMGPDHAHPMSGMVTQGVESGAVLMGNPSLAATAAPPAALVAPAAGLATIPGPMAAPQPTAPAPTPTLVPAATPKVLMSAPLVVTPYGSTSVIASTPNLLPGVNVDGSLLLTLGLAGMTGLSALVLFGTGGAVAETALNSPEHKPYVGSGGSQNTSGITITSSAAQTVEEGEIGTFSIVTASDADGDTLSFAISGGRDASSFSIDMHTGALTYTSASLPMEGDPSQSDPDFSALTGDADDTRASNGNNTLDLMVRVSDPDGNAATQALTFYIQNDTRDDRVEDYVLASETARITKTETNSLTDMVDAALGRDSNGDALVLSVDGGDRVSITQLDGQGGASLTSFGTANADYSAIALGDIDGDGRLDAVVAGRLDGGNIVQLWESNGLGHFALELTALEGGGTTDLDASGMVSDVVIGEFNGSGNLDVFISNDGGDDTLLALTGNYGGTLQTVSGLDAAERSVVISEAYINSSTDYVASIEDGDVALIDVKDMLRMDQVSGSYVDLAVYRDKVFAADSTGVDVFEADTNSLDDETLSLVTGHQDIVKILLGNFDDNHTDVELAVLDQNGDTLSLYEMDRNFDSATLLYSIDVDADAATLLDIPQSVELSSALGGNLADDILVGGLDSALYYDDTSL